MSRGLISYSRLVGSCSKMALDGSIIVEICDETMSKMWRKPVEMNTAAKRLACVRLSASGHFFSHTFKSDHSLPRALGFILCEACGSVVLLHAAGVFHYFVNIEIAFMDNQAQITETINRLDSEKVR